MHLRLRAHCAGNINPNMFAPTVDVREAPDFNAETHPYGLCPQCGAPGASREKRIGGNDICENNHTYPSATSLSEIADPGPDLNL